MRVGKLAQGPETPLLPRREIDRLPWAADGLMFAHAVPYTTWGERGWKRRVVLCKAAKIALGTFKAVALYLAVAATRVNEALY